MAISTRIVANSIKVLQQYRLDSLLTMNKVMADATKFTKAHGIVDELPAASTRRVPRHAAAGRGGR
jgi:hypothetical protein